MIYLQVPFKEKDQAKQLGARWDAVSKRWYIPDDFSGDETLFDRWRDDVQAFENTSQNSPIRQQNLAIDKATSDRSTALNLADIPQGISLSQMMMKVQNAIRISMPGAIWVIAEIANLNTRKGHVYLELTETNEQGQSIASCRSMIWQSQAQSLLKNFEEQTSTPLQVGQKVLLLVEASFHHQFGFSLVVQDIDASFTLGEQERKLNEIRKSLLVKGIYAQNKSLALAKDFFRIAVIAPLQAAGLGDFRADADILSKHQLCEFKYIYSRFQGNSVESELLEALKAIQALHSSKPFDALVIIRGGGAKLDLNQLNIESVAEVICQLKLPVLSGIGHERDATIIDEVAHTRFDTPSKVIGFIKQQIFDQAQKAKVHWQSIEKSSSVRVHYLHNKINQLNMQIQQYAQAGVHDWKTQLEPIKNSIAHYSHKSISQYQNRIDNYQQTLIAQTNQNLQRKKLQSDQLLQNITLNANRAVDVQKKQIIQSISFILSSGPKVQLNRGFALVKDSTGRPITKKTAAVAAHQVQIEFADGSVSAKIEKD